MSKFLLSIVAIFVLSQTALGQENKYQTVVNEGLAVELISKVLHNNSRINPSEIRLNDDNSIHVIYLLGRGRRIKQCSATVKVQQDEDSLRKYTVEQGFCVR